MKFKTGLVLGLGIGYVLGTRAGRERYEQLKAALDAAAANPQVRNAIDVADRRTRTVRKVVGDSMVTAAGAVKDRAGG